MYVPISEDSFNNLEVINTILIVDDTEKSQEFKKRLDIFTEYYPIGIMFNSEYEKIFKTSSPAPFVITFTNFDSLSNPIISTCEQFIEILKSN